MIKGKGVLDRFENGSAVIRFQGKDLVVPRDIFKNFTEGDELSICIKKTSGKQGKNKLQKLLTRVLGE